MKQEDTKQKILDKALELFSTQGYDSVSVGEIAKAVGIKVPSLYNHFPSKQAIFDAIVESTAAQYEADTDKIDIHVQNAKQDIPVFTEITADALFGKVRQIFEYSLHNETISRFRRMMTIEQFRSPELAALYSRRYVERILRYHAGIFRALIASGEICAGDPDALAMMYVSTCVSLSKLKLISSSIIGSLNLMDLSHCPLGWRSSYIWISEINASMICRFSCSLMTAYSLSK